MKKIFISTYPFSEINNFPKELLKSNSIEFSVNPLKRKLTESELIKYSDGMTVLIAGTEKISKQFFNKRPEVKFIS